MSEEADLQETFEHSLLYFIQHLDVMAMEPVEQCEAWGNYNVAWEITTDLKRDGDVISTFECSYLSEHQKQEVMQFINSLGNVPENLLIAATTATANQVAMSHPVWTPIRENAVNLIKILESATDRNKKYFSL